MMKDAAGIIAISDNIVETIKDLYNLEFNNDKLCKVYLGVDENTKVPNRPDRDTIRSYLLADSNEGRAYIQYLIQYQN